MAEPTAYELTFPHPGQDTPDRVVVRRTASKGAAGSTVYADDSGIVRAEISGDGEVRMLPSGGRQALTRPSDIKPLT